jgi:hypothetical protein
MREFQVSPSAQLYRETLQCHEIIPISVHETICHHYTWFWGLKQSFMQIFWVYFPAPVEDSLRSQVSKIKGIRPAPPFGPGVSRDQYLQTQLPVWKWATEPEVLHGNQVHLLLWPHFWSSEKHAEWRHNPYAQKRFIERVEGLDSVELKDEIYQFSKMPKL